MPGFTHLHVHSEYSLLDGLTRVPDLVAIAKERGFDALALTDHGVMFGAVQFYQQAQKVGVKPIIGCELYVAPRSRHDKDPKKDARAHHLTALAANEAGYRNLMALTSQAQLEGFYYKPRVDRDLLEAHAEGLVVFSGCPSSEVSRQLRDGLVDDARETMAWYRDVFADRYYVELQHHDIDFLPALNKRLLGLASELDLPLVATNDVHYARPQDVRAHEVLLCVQTGTTVTNPDRMRLGSSFYLRTEEEMRELFSETPEALTATAAIAEMCNVELDFETYHLPVFDVPPGYDSSAAYLESLCTAGLEKRFDGEPGDDARRRLAYELEVIHSMGFDDYFLIVWDLCRFARSEGIWWNVRGSGAGALVSYCLGITNIDPLQHKLIFERFLNPSRVSMPDIDLDFPDDQRETLIRYAFDRYGTDRVAQIITFGTMGARGAIRDAGRALDMPLSLVDQVARLVPAIAGKPCRIEDTMRPPSEDDPNEFYTPELVDMAQTQDDVQELLSSAQSLEGVTRHASTHAAGVVITDRPLLEYVPLHRPTSTGDGALPLTQFPMNDVERLGLVKMDFLGLSTLTVLRRAAELVESTHGHTYTLDSIPLDDPAIYELLSSGQVTGVFQVEGAGMRRMLKEMQPRRFEHVVAAIALYRPGPMEYIPTYIARMHGREEVRYRHEALRPILEETYGILVYQEQIIQVARDLAGYDPGEADTIRKAVAKKIKPKLLEHHHRFVAGATANGIPEDVAEGIWRDIETFARYGFNKAHAADYAVIVCQTAYFKAHYPLEYMAALLSVERGDTDKVGLITAACHRMGIRLLAPSVQHSVSDFTIEPLPPHERLEGGRRRGIRFGLAAVKNVGEGAVDRVLAGRSDRPFHDLDDFCRRVDLRHVGKRPLECLVRVGALDDFGSRAGLLAMLDQIVAYSAGHHEATERGQLSLFDGAAAEPALLGAVPQGHDDPEAALGWEKALLGLYLSEHPLHRLADDVADRVTHLLSDVDEGCVGQTITVAGMVADVRRITTKKGAAMAFAQLEDLQGRLDLTVFPRVYEDDRALWSEDRLLLLTGRVELREDRVQLLVDSASDYSRLRDLRAAASEEAAGVASEPEEQRPGTPPAPHSDAPAADPSGVAAGSDASARTAEADTAGAYQLTITLPRTDDMDEDIALLKQVYSTLQRYDGQDRFAVRVQNGTGLVELDFPNMTTRYCVGLVQRLDGLLGAGRLQAVQVQG